MGLCLISPAVRQGMKSGATSLCLRMLNRESYAPKWRTVGEYCKCQRSKLFIILIIKQDLWAVYMCCWFHQVRVPSQWSQVPLCPPGMVSNMVRGWEPWAAVIRSCDGTCWACRGHCLPTFCILSTLSPSHLVNFMMLPSMSQLDREQIMWQVTTELISVYVASGFMFYNLCFVFWSARISL